ncbi:MAG TPA: transcriptional repressor LexA [Myxococcota bacterium]|nr:transcriptional repressor LexA [Myxococcota bacterium]
MALTRRQRELYDFVCAFIAEHGYSPSLEEIGRTLGLSSVATVHKHVAQLVAKGWLQKGWNRARSLEPVASQPAGELSLPLLGVVAAGVPIESVEVQDRIAVPAGLVRHPEASFVLQVRGDSMIDEQIRDGDFVVVERRSEVRDGDTVVAVLRGGEATLKKLQRRGATVRLLPANARMKPIEVPAGEVEVRGVVRGLLRRY